MPLYEYECATCGERTEAIQRSGDPLLTVCPHCGGALRKLLSAPSFQFKGSGFYVTDYGKAWEKKNGDKTGEKEKSSSKGEEGKPSSASSGGDARGSGPSDSSKGEKDGGAGAGKTSPGASSPPAPSKKKKDDTK